MKSIALLLLALITAPTLTSNQTNTKTADLVFKNGNVYTANERQSQAEAIAVKGDRIVFVGSNREAQK